MGQETSLKSENKMGTMPENKLLVSMAVPIVISMLVQALYNVVDSMFVAQINENALTAVSMAFPIQNLMIAVAVGTGVGMNALLSRSLGEHNFERANRTANNSVFLALMSYLVFLVFGFTGIPFFYNMQTDIHEILEFGETYLFIVTMGSFAIFFQIAFERMLQATGRTIYTMISQATGALINIILDPILIFGYFGLPKMGVAGAALATVTGQVVGMTLAIILNLKKNEDIQFSFAEMKPDRYVIRKIYEVGVPSIIMTSIMSVMSFCMNNILMLFSSTATAVFGAYFKLQSFIFMPVFGLNNGMVPIIAYNYGAKQRKRITKVVKLALTYAFIIMTTGFVVFQLFADRLLMMFNASEAMMAIGVPAMRIISISFPMAAVSIISISVLQALGHGVYSMFISIGRQLVVLVPLAYIFAKMGSLVHVWTAFPIAEVVSVLLSFLFLHKVFKSLDF